MRDNLIIRMDSKTAAFWTNTSACIGSRYVPARPMGFASILYRIHATWLVWTGRADALVWPAGQ